MSTIPTLNEHLMACVLDHIEHHLDEYNQNIWCRIRGSLDDEYCGTAGCFAGWTMLLTTPVDKWKETIPQDRTGIGLSEEMRQYFYNEAPKRLGLTKAEAGELFSPCCYVTPQHQLDVIKNRIRAIRTAKGLSPDPPPLSSFVDTPSKEDSK